MRFEAKSVFRKAVDSFLGKVAEAKAYSSDRLTISRLRKEIERLHAQVGTLERQGRLADKRISELHREREALCELLRSKGIRSVRTWV